MKTSTVDGGKREGSDEREYWDEGIELGDMVITKSLIQESDWPIPRRENVIFDLSPFQSLLIFEWASTPAWPLH